MPSYNIKGEPIENTYSVVKAPVSVVKEPSSIAKQTTYYGSGGGSGMGCGGNSGDDCNCGKACCCFAVGITALILIVKYAC
jgi:hypothetical protein